jgi:O-antigen/teichoic acid export membrane protein
LPIVPVILLGYVFSGMYAVVTAGLYIQKKTSVLPWIAGAGAVVNVAVCMFAVRHWARVGVAWATPIAYGLMAVLGAWQAEQVYPVPYEWGRLARLALIVGAIFAADRWLGMQGWGSSQPAAWGIKFALLLAFPLVLWVTRFVRPTEIQTLKSMLGRKPAPA